MESVRIFVGYDPREAIAYHVFCESLVSNSSVPLEIHPLALNTLSSLYNEQHADGSNQFIYSRFLTPYLSNFEGYSIYCDGDMIVNGDIAKLANLFDKKFAVQCVQHDYKTKVTHKYFGNENENYPRKNWSSVILFNNAHPSNKVLTPDFVSKQTGAYLHRFSWLENHQIGRLPKTMNWLVTEYENKPDAFLHHYTLGTPCIEGYETCDQAENWFSYLNSALRGSNLSSE